MSTINRLSNAYVNTQTDASYQIISTYQTDNTFVNKGKSEFEKEVVFDVPVAIGKAIDPSYNLDISGNLRVSDVARFLTAPIMSGANISSLSIPNSALSSTVLFTSGAQAITGIKTFTVPPVLSGASITSNTIPDSALSNAVITTSNLVATIRDTALTRVGIGAIANASYALDITGATRFRGNVQFLSPHQVTFSTGNVTFQGPPTMSGANISGVVQLDVSQNITSTKVFDIPQQSYVVNYLKFNQSQDPVDPSGYVYINNFGGIGYTDSSLNDKWNLQITGDTTVRDITCRNISAYVGAGQVTLNNTTFSYTDPSNNYWALNTNGVVFYKGATVEQGLTASSTQTIDFGSNAPTMSGANISNRTIPNSAFVSTSQSYTTVITGTTFTLSTPLYEIYPFSITANLVVTLPAASSALLGSKITFRRVGGTVTYALQSASSNVYPSSSNTAGITLMGGSTYLVTIQCTYLTSSTYGWFVV